MAPIAAFGICIVLTLLLIGAFIILTGGAFIFIVHALSSAIIQSIAKLFGIRMSDRSTPLFFLIILFVLTLIVFISSIFFSVYWMIWGHTIAYEATPAVPVTIDTTKLVLFTGLNKILLVTLGYFFCSFIYNRIKFRKQHASNMQFNLSYVILPLISFFLSSVYLIASLYYLIDFPAKESIGVFPSVAGCLYIPYMLYSLGRTIYVHIRYKEHIFPTYTFGRALQLGASIVYDAAFLYFFYQTAAALRFY